MENNKHFYSIRWDPVRSHRANCCIKVKLKHKLFLYFWCCCCYCYALNSIQCLKMFRQKIFNFLSVPVIILSLTKRLEHCYLNQTLHSRSSLCHTIQVHRMEIANNLHDFVSLLHSVSEMLWKCCKCVVWSDSLLKCSNRYYFLVNQRMKH